MGKRALRGQSGFNEGRAVESGFAVGGGGGFEFQPLGKPSMPQGYPVPPGPQISAAPPNRAYAPPGQAYAPLGAPPTTVQAHAMQAVLQRVQELVIAHANIPSNATTGRP